MNTQRAAEIQVVLEGVPLPATRAELIAYAREQDPGTVRDLEALPDREFDRLDAVGALLAPAPHAAPEPAPLPKAESGEQPGGDDYLTPFPKDTGRVRHDAPPSNPPQKAIDKASQTVKEQKAAEGG